MEKLFDLNIEQVLQHWGLEHAIREIIANAIDEQTLTNTDEIQIYEDKNNRWHIRDYGRGLQYCHFSQNENTEKLNAPNLIGKFGVGLKDALAVFYRHDVQVEINSKYALISLRMTKKEGFDMNTLHAVFNDPLDKQMIGTEYIITGITNSDIDHAKSMFLKFSNSKLLESTKYGDVYSRNDGSAYVYINGVQVAEEDNFMFCYNITNINSRIKAALNRERTNVGRTAYADSIKKILTQCSSAGILVELINDLPLVMSGENKDESLWLDVSTYAAKTLNNSGEVVFLTPTERADLSNEQVEILEQSGKKPVYITDTLKEKLEDSVSTFNGIMKDYSNSFVFEFVSYDDLSIQEKLVFDMKEIVINFLNKHHYNTDIPVLISETIRITDLGEQANGYCDGHRIIIRRKALVTDCFLGTLLHEYAHFNSGAMDNTRAFETELTDLLGFAMNDRFVENSSSNRRLIRRLFKQCD